MYVKDLLVLCLHGKVENLRKKKKDKFYYLKHSSQINSLPDQQCSPVPSAYKTD
jgi:hypothetical protein